MLKDLTGALLLFFIALGYYGFARDISESSLADEIGAAGLPIVYASVLAGLAVLLAASTLIGWRLLPKPMKTPVATAQGEGGTLGRAAGMLSVGIVSVGALPYAGYVISVAGMIGIVAVYQGEVFGWRLVRIAGGGAVVFWILFDRILGVDLPTGIWSLLWGG